MIEIDCQQGTEEWLDARAGACTASRFSLARERMKQNRGTRRVGDFTEACEKYALLLAIERIYGKHLDETFATWQMRRGQELEPVARELYEARTGYVVETAGLVLTDDRMFGYSTDGKAYGHKGRCEIKCPTASEKVAGVWIDPAPVIAEYIDQCDGGLWITGDEWIDLVVYTPWLASVGKDLFIHRIERNDDRINALETDLMAFYRLTSGYEAKLRTPVGVEPPPWAEADSITPLRRTVQRAVEAVAAPAPKAAPAAFALPDF